MSNYLHGSKSLVRCKCERIVKVPDERPRKITCPCGRKLLVNRCCDEEWHAPVPCYIWQIASHFDPTKKAKKTKKVKNPFRKYEPLFDWIDRNTKRCPRCRVPVLKDRANPVENCPQCDLPICDFCLEGHKPDQCQYEFRISSQGQCTSILLKGIFSEKEYKEDYVNSNEYMEKLPSADMVKAKVAPNSGVLVHGGIQFVNQLANVGKQLELWRKDMIRFYTFRYFFTIYSPSARAHTFETDFQRFKDTFSKLSKMICGDLSRTADLETLETWRDEVLRLATVAKDLRKKMMEDAVKGTRNLTFQFLMTYRFIE